MSKLRIIYSCSALVMLFVGAFVLFYNPHQENKQADTSGAILQKGMFTEMDLQDFYKANFQSFFGAEHLAPDTAIVLRYLNYELSNVDTVWIIPDLQDISGYYRVSLRLVADGVLSLDSLVDGFIESAQPVEHQDGEWLARWQEIERKVLQVYPELADSTLQANLLEAAQLNAAVRHSQHYRDVYQPHYRIIRKDIVERWYQNGTLPSTVKSKE